MFMGEHDIIITLVHKLTFSYGNWEQPWNIVSEPVGWAEFLMNDSKAPQTDILSESYMDKYFTEIKP